MLRKINYSLTEIGLPLFAVPNGNRVIPQLIYLPLNSITMLLKVRAHTCRLNLYFLKIHINLIDVIRNALDL